MSLEAQWHLVLGLVATVLFVVAGFSFGGWASSNDPPSDALYGGLRWLSFGLAALAFSSIMPPFQEKK
jgi:hypothetical protein